jgi:hypothetical protein
VAIGTAKPNARLGNQGEIKLDAGKRIKMMVRSSSMWKNIELQASLQPAVATAATKQFDEATAEIRRRH